MHRRHEDDRRPLEARVLADHRRQLVAVEVRHADVDQDDGDLVASAGISSASLAELARDRAFSPSSPRIAS